MVVALDTRIPFMGVQPNFVNALAQGSQAAGMRNEMARTNALAGVLQQHGPGIMAGDPNALNALAVYDPQAALGVMDTRQGMDARALGMDATRQSMAREAQAWAMTLDDRQAAEAREGIGRAIMQLETTTTPQAWDAMATQMGKPELVGQFGRQEELLMELRPFADALARRDQMAAPPAAPDAQSAIAKLQQDFNNGLITADQLALGMQSLGPQSPATVNVNTGENSNAFVKAGDEAAAARFNGYIEAGTRATELMGDLQMLGQLAGQINTGAGAQVTAALGPIAQELGIEVHGLGEMQAFQSIVDRLAPALRPPGSGASSDFDARQFLSSLPSLGRTPEGNQIINETFNAIMQHRQAAAQIASNAFETGESWTTAEAKIRALGNPFEAFNAYNQSAVQPEGASGFAPTTAVPRTDAPPVVVTDEDYNALPSGTVFTDETGATFRKP